MQGKVLIVTRTKNRPLLLLRCLQSVLNQTHTNWLQVIVNDGGDAATVDALTARFADLYQGRLKVIHNETSTGMQHASNQAIQATQSEFIAIHDDDDTWNPIFLAECMRYLQAAGTDSTEQGVAAQTIWITEEIDSWGKVTEQSRKDYLPFESVSLFQTAGKNSFPPIAFLYRRKVHDTIGYFDQTFNELGDHDFNLRFLSHFDIGVVPKRLAGYHWRHQANGTSYGNTVTDGVASHRRMLVKMQNHYLRQDLANGRTGLGLLLNIAANAEAQAAWIQGLHGKSEAVAESVRRVVRKLQYYEQLADGVLSPWKSKAFPRRVYDQLVDLVMQAGKSRRVSSEKSGRLNLAQLEASVKKAGVLSLDVFDTALLRLVRKPTDVFLYIQNDVRHLLNRPGLGFVEVRVAAEAESRQELRRLRGVSETTLDDIYAVLRRSLGCDEQTAGRIKKLELRAEHRLCYANPELAPLAARARNAGQKLVFSSDMYLPAGEITGLLERNGFKSATLFVSSELSVTKHEGGLFDHLSASLNCRPEEVLHVGDNAHSDVDRARAKGITAYHWTRSPSQMPLVDQQTSNSGAWEGDLASSLYTGLVRRRRLECPVTQAEGRAFWEMLGYEVVGPLYHAFVSWTIARATALGLKKLFFLARDGFQLVKVFDLFREKNSLGMEASYLFASRRLWNIPRIDRLDEANLSLLITPNPCLRVGDFLARAGINPGPHEALARRFGFKNLDQCVTTPKGSFTSETTHQNMRRLIRELESQILALAAEERTKLLDYFKEAGLLRDGNGIVDLGWQASSLKSLHELLTLAGQSQKIPGFYFGTWAFARATADAGCQFESFFMHLDQPLHRARIVSEGVELMESFFSASHPTIIGLDRKNENWEPVYGEPEIDANTEAALQLVTGAALEFVRDALAIWPDSQELAPPFGYLETVLERLLCHPREDEAAALGKFSWRNTFGGSGPLRQLANPPSPWARISRSRALQDAYNDCYWKSGFMAQLSPRAKKYLQT